MSYFFTPHMPENGILTGSIIDHLISTRIQPNQQISITDLKGSRWQVKLVHLDKKLREAQVSFVEFEYIKQSIAYPSCNNTLIQAQIDKPYLEKMFEVLPFSSFDKVVLFKSQYSLNQSTNLERLDKILTRSLEQSEKIYRPEIILSQDSIEKLIHSEYSRDRLNLVLDTRDSTPVAQPTLSNNTVWIGPEGGWSQSELSTFDNLATQDNSQFESINLGNLIYPAWLCSLSIR